MGKKKPLMIIAMGGNALIGENEKGTIGEQERHAAIMCKHVVPILQQGHNLVITHGNGPQVGMSLIRNERTADLFPAMPLDVCVADTQGTMGYILQQALLNALRRKRIDRSVVTMITQVLVRRSDPAFQKPSKPIGPFYDGAEAARATKKGWHIVEDAGRGWRRVVPSPKPMKILQKDMIGERARRGDIVIAVGGGGIPVWRKSNGDYEGIEAVIEKDLATLKLATELRADLLVMLTYVERVCLNFGTAEEQPLDRVSARQARKLMKQGHFPPGSMGPKVAAAAQFVANGGKRAIITSPKKLVAALDGKTGTTFVP